MGVNFREIQEVIHELEAWSATEGEAGLVEERLGSLDEKLDATLERIADKAKSMLIEDFPPLEISSLVLKIVLPGERVVTVQKGANVNKELREDILPNINMGALVFGSKTSIHRSRFYVFKEENKEIADFLSGRKRQDTYQYESPPNCVIIPYNNAVPPYLKKWLSKWKSDEPESDKLETDQLRLECLDHLSSSINENRRDFQKYAMLTIVDQGAKLFAGGLEAMQQLKCLGAYPISTERNDQMLWGYRSVNSEIVDLEAKLLNPDVKSLNFPSVSRHLFWWSLYVMKCALNVNQYVVFAANPTNLSDELSGVVVVANLRTDRIGEQVMAIEYIANVLLSIVDRLSLTYAFEQKSKAEKEKMDHARRAAAVAIMARNWAHHWGSHVAPRTGNEDLRIRVREFYGKRVIELALKQQSFNEMFDRVRARLDDYQRRKGEFIAEVTTSPMMSTRAALFYKDICLPFLRTTALIDTIAANENLGYTDYKSSTLRVRVFRQVWKEQEEKFDVVEFQPQYKIPGTNMTIHSAKDKYRAVPYGERSTLDRGLDLESDIENEGHDIQVALPGPVGEMAFYGFLENLIRNAAKHGGERTKTLEIHIVLWHEMYVHQEWGDPHDDYVVVDIYDNLTRSKTPVIVSNSDGQDSQKTLMDKLNEYIINDIVDTDGKSRQYALGLAEMSIDTALMRGVRDFHTHLGEKSLKVFSSSSESVQPFLTENQEIAEKANDLLVYSFRMMKARIALFIGFDEQKVPTLSNLKQTGYRFFDSIEQHARGIGREENSPAAFQFVVLTQDTFNVLQRKSEQIIQGTLNPLPLRIIVIGEKPSNLVGPAARKFAFTPKHPQWGKKQDSVELHKWLWTAWLGTRGANAGSTSTIAGIDLFLGQDKEDKQTAKWGEHASRFNKFYDKKRHPWQCRVWNKTAGMGFEPCPGKDTMPAWNGGGERGRLVLDRHGLFSAYSGKEANDLHDRLLVLDKANADFDILFNPSSFDTIFYELIEAGSLNVLVLDERLAQKSMQLLEGETGDRPSTLRCLVGREDLRSTFWHVAARAGVFIATHINVKGKPIEETAETAMPFDVAGSAYKKRKDRWGKGGACPSLKLEIDLDETVISKTEEQRAGPKNQNENENLEVDPESLCDLDNIDIVLVHQGILDRVRNYYSNGTAFVEALHKKFPWVIIESGRGIPPDVQRKQDKFLPYSVVEMPFTGKRVAKLTLIRQIMELTRNV